MRPLIGIAVLSVFLVSACSSSADMVRKKLDPLTSVTINYSQSPLVFYRDVSGRAAYARDYVHLAPLEVNRSGSYRYYLWLGIWTTMDHARSERIRDGFESIVVYSDGEPLALSLAGWTAEAIGASEPVYVKPVASATDAYYEVTIDQLRLIAQAKSVRVTSTGPHSESYEPWDNQKSAKASFDAFLQLAIF